MQVHPYSILALKLGHGKSGKYTLIEKENDNVSQNSHLYRIQGICCKIIFPFGYSSLTICVFGIIMFWGQRA